MPVLSLVVLTLAVEPRKLLQSQMNGCPVRLKPEAQTEVICCAGYSDPPFSPSHGQKRAVTSALYVACLFCSFWA